MKTYFPSLLLLLLIGMSPRSYGQYLNRVYDYDSTGDWGYSVFIQTDGNYFTIGGGKRGEWTLMGKRIDVNGNEQINKTILKSPSYSYYEGSPGAIKMLADGGYIVPLTASRFNVLGSSGQYVKLAGLARLTKTGDTLWVKYYTDTVHHSEYVADCVQLPDGGFVIVGERRYYTPQTPGHSIIIRTDSLGNLLWRKDHPACSAFLTVDYNSIGQIIVGGMTRTIVQNWQDWYYHNTPWFLSYDTSGNLITDRQYSNNQYGGGGSVYKDMNGGYFHYGTYDSLYNNSIFDYRSFPEYVAHLDDSFNVTWAKKLTHQQGHQYIWRVKQLRDSCYLIIGNLDETLGWVTKVDRNGFTMWNSYYFIDSTWSYLSYLTDAAEGADGRLVVTGSARSPNIPPWRGWDVWLLVLDKNGCIIPGCNPLSVDKPITEQEKAITIFPNPVARIFTARTTENGVLKLFNLQGQEMGNYTVTKGNNRLQMPAKAAAGTYLAAFISEKDRQVVTIRIVYEP